MTFLELVRSAAIECNVIEAESDITTTASQTGDLLRIVRWTIAAWRELQTSKRSWRFMRSRFSLNTVSGTKRYAYTDCTDTIASATISRFRNWFVDDPMNRPKAYLTSGGIGSQFYLTFIPWDEFQTIYEIGSAPSGQPCYISVDPQNKLVLGPTPSDDYTVTGEYYKSAQVFVAGTDDDVEPDGLMDDFHELIVYDVMRKYGTAEVAQEIIARADKEGGALRSDFLADQLPRWRDTPPMA